MATARRGLNVLVQVCSIIAAFALTDTAANAEDQYPSKPVRIVVSFAAGGPTDQVARVMSAKLTELLGQTFVVENKTGAGGNLGAADVARAAPDGYLLLMATVSTHAINPGLYKSMPYDPLRDFTPVGQVGVTPCVLAVSNSGIYHLSAQGQTTWHEFTEAAPAFITMLAMPLTFSIATGLSLGLICFTLVKVAAGKIREVPLLVWVLTALFLLRYVYLAMK